MRTMLATAAVISMSGALVACGGDSASSPATTAGSVIEIDMTDNAFTPTVLQVRRGEPVTLRFTNRGTVRHEALVGSMADQQAHAADMAGSGGGMSGGMSGGTSDAHMDDHGDAADQVTVDPGGSAELTLSFDTAGEVLIGCHEPGHWEAGMRSAISVT